MAIPKAGDGASSQKRGKGSQKEEVTKELYLTIFLDDFADAAHNEETTGKSKKKQKSKKKGAKPAPQADPLPTPFSNLYKLYNLFRTPSEIGKGKENESYEVYYVRGCDVYTTHGEVLGAVRGTNHTMEEAQELDDSWLANWLSLKKMRSSTDQLSRAATFIYTWVINMKLAGNVKSANLHFNFFGYGRGAFTARALAFFVNPDDQFTLSQKQMKLFGLQHTKGIIPMEDFSFIKSKKVHIMGLFDTTSTVGAPRTEPYDTFMRSRNIQKRMEFYADCRHDTNADDFGLYSTKVADHVLHLCAMDEHRTFFPLVDIESSLSNGTEIFLPGCHEDIGGGNIGSNAFISEVADNLPFILALKTKPIDKMAQSLSNEINTMKVTDLQNCVQAYNTFNGKHETIRIEQFEQANELLKKMLDFFKNSPEIKLIVDIRDYADWLKKEIEMAEKEDHSKANRQESRNAANKFDNTWEEIDKYHRFVQSAFNTFKDSCEFIIKKANKIPPVNDNWRKAQGDGRNLSQDLMHTVELLNDRFAKSREVIEEIRDLIDDNKNWFFGNQPKQIVLPKGLPFEKPKDKNDLMPICGRAVRALGWVQDRTCTLLEYLETGKPHPDENDYSESASWNEDGISANELGKIFTGAETPIYGTAVFKHSLGGYNLVPLKLMWQWCKNIDPDMMTAWPQEYVIPDDLQMFYRGIESAIQKKGRIFAYPNDDFEEGYRTLRCKYLQFSPYDLSKEKRISTGGCTYDAQTIPNKLIITRRVYPGKQGSRSPFDHGETFKYIYDYEGEHIKVNVNFNAEFDDHWFVADKDGSMSEKLHEFELHESLKNPDNLYTKEELERMDALAADL